MGIRVYNVYINNSVIYEMLLSSYAQKAELESISSLKKTCRFHHSRMTNPPATSASRSRGRPREFDIDAALDKAALIFGERGFYATSISELTSAMELASGSVYKAFKDKRAVFVAAFDRMHSMRIEKLRHIVSSSKPARDRIHDVVNFYADAASGVDGKRGCLLVSSTMGLSTFDVDVAQRVTSGLRGIETLLANLVRKGQKDGSISTDVDSEATARLLLCVIQGMRVIGKTGRTRAQMRQAASTAMKLLD